MTQDNLNIVVADWTKDKEKLSKIRRIVFIDEQNVPEELEWDDDDADSIHFLVSIEQHVVATARLKKDGQIGRMAVLKEYRNQGIGSTLLAFVLQTAAQNRHKKVYLHAQTSAIHFYEKQGFKAYGEIFYEANIPHRGMLLNIC